MLLFYFICGDGALLWFSVVWLLVLIVWFWSGNSCNPDWLLTHKQPRWSLFWCSFLHLLSAVVTSVYHHTRNLFNAENWNHCFTMLSKHSTNLAISPTLATPVNLSVPQSSLQKSKERIKVLGLDFSLCPKFPECFRLEMFTLGVFFDWCINFFLVSSTPEILFCLL
jgi:hypothetical protein